MSARSDTLRYMRGREQVLGNAAVVERLAQIEDTQNAILHQLVVIAARLQIGEIDEEP